MSAGIDYGLGKTNIDLKTGVRYGIAHANNYPELFDEITTNGNDDSYDDFIEQIVRDITCAVENADEDSNEELIDAIQSCVHGVARNPRDIIEDHIDDLEERPDEWTDFVKSLVDEFEFEYTNDENIWSYTETDDAGNVTLHLQITWLGGAPQIFVFKSPKIVKALLCSPCVPGAGDLDSLDDNGVETYGIPDEWVNVRE